MYLSRQLTAKDASIIAYWASKAGAVGLCEQLSFRPGARTGNYARHLDSVLRTDEAAKSLYSIKLVGHHKHDVRRT
eukprot:5084893-Alexandrium_andersonii.AAC.1